MTQDGPDFTIGIEEEYLLVDRDSLALAEAPSESWLALPAVMKAPSPRTGLSLARPSRVVSGRLPSSLDSVTISR